MKRSLFLLILLPALSWAQSSYYDYPVNEKYALYEDHFNNNNFGWNMSDSETTLYQMNNGIYTVERTKDSGTSNPKTRKMKIDQSSDFEIEARIKVVKTDFAGYSNGLFWGSKGPDYNFFLAITSRGSYQIVKRDDDWHKYVGYTNEHVKAGDFNLLTVRKVKSNYYFFINRTFVKSIPFEPFMGDMVGVTANKGTTIAVDYIKVHDLSPNGIAAIQAYTDKKIAEWAKKGEFEKTADYQARVTDANLRTKAREFQEEKLVDLKKRERVKYSISNFTLGSYDADNETFLLTGPGRDYVLPVPISQAPTVKSSFYGASIKNHDFTLTEEGLKLSQFTLNVSGVGSYNWDHLQDNPFQQTDVSVNLGNLGLQVATGTVSDNANITKKSLTVGQSDVDISIPKTSNYNPDAIAVVIGNGNYQGDVPNVDFAIHDAEIMKEYLLRTFGLKPGNILYEENATKTKLEILLGNDRQKGKLANYVKSGKSDVYFFYSGHGAPDTNTKTGYLMPVDADPSTLAITGYSIETLYNNLGKLNARSVQVVIDACFSGGSSSGKMLINQASPIGIQVKNPAATMSNGTIITASQGDQISSWYAEKSHGLLTYFYLRGLRGDADLNSDKRITSGEMKRYLQDQTEGVPYWARRLHGRDQVPEVFSGSEQVIVELR